MKKLKKHCHFLNYLSKCTPKQRKVLLSLADKSQIACLSEICLNVLAGNVNADVKKLRKYKTAIRQLSKRSTCLKKKKQLLSGQTGGFLPIILPALVSALAGMAGRAIGNRI